MKTQSITIGKIAVAAMLVGPLYIQTFHHDHLDKWLNHEKQYPHVVERSPTPFELWFNPVSVAATITAEISPSASPSASIADEY